MLVGATPRRVAIVGGVRIPFARGNGAYAQVGNQEMLDRDAARPSSNDTACKANAWTTWRPAPS